MIRSVIADQITLSVTYENLIVEDDALSVLIMMMMMMMIINYACICLFYS